MMKTKEIFIYALAFAVARTLIVILTSALMFKGLFRSFLISFIAGLGVLIIIYYCKTYKLRRDAR